MSLALFYRALAGAADPFYQYWHNITMGMVTVTAAGMGGVLIE